VTENIEYFVLLHFTATTYASAAAATTTTTIIIIITTMFQMCFAILGTS
jgi:hypothetical protein